MRTWKLPLLLAVGALCAPATASAAFEHTIAPGESLSSVAAADGLSVDQLAAANGLSSASQLVAGESIAIPPQTSSAAASAASPVQSAATSSSTYATTSSSSSNGGYVVAPGDTLSAIAARYGVSVDGLAAANGLDPDGVLPAGDTLSVTGASSAAAEPVSTTVSSSTSGASGTSSASGSSGSSAQPTAESVSPTTVGSIAAEDGVSPSLAEAIAEQESGFNNNEVSSTGATGVMQIEPGTWSYINQLGGPTLAPDSAADNIRGGVTYLHALLDQTGGDPTMAAAAYYQGLTSLRQHGMYADTQQYVNDVMALRSRYGG